jgi:hypothetical protein
VERLRELGLRELDYIVARVIRECGLELLLLLAVADAPEFQ